MAQPTTTPIRGVRRSWLGARAWPAYCAAGFTTAYGLFKAYWVFGGTALWDIAPLPQSMIDKARAHTADPWFVAADAATLALALVGVLFALATVRPRRRSLPTWAVRYSLWPLSALMVLRAVVTGLGDLHQLAAGTFTRTAFWDLALWSPFFLIWGVLWAPPRLPTVAVPERRRVVSGAERLTRAHRVVPAAGPAVSDSHLPEAESDHELELERVAGSQPGVREDQLGRLVVADRRIAVQTILRIAGRGRQPPWQPFGGCSLTTTPNLSVKAGQPKRSS